MNATPAPPTFQDLSARVAAVLDRLREFTAPAGPGDALVAAIAAHEGSGDSHEIADRARELAHLLDELQTELKDAQQQAQRVERASKRHSVGSGAYWAELQVALADAGAQSPHEELAVWLRFFGEAFAAWRLDVCERLTEEANHDNAAMQKIRRPLKDAVAALRTTERAAALPGLAILIDEHPGGLATSPLDDGARAAALLVRGRIQLHDKGDQRAALADFEQARQAAPQDGRVSAALAEYHRARGDEGAVRDLNRQTIAASPDRPDGYINMALSCEAQLLWAEARDWYAQAVNVVLARAAEGDPLAELGHLLAPVTGGLYLRLGRATLSQNPETARLAAESALALGIQAEGRYPHSAAHQLKGDALEALRRNDEAAKALFEAGQYNAWDNNADAALALFERVSKLDPNMHRNYWSWADALLAKSYITEPPNVDADRINRSLEVWNAGIALALPERTLGWPYLTRAIIAQQLGNLPGANRWEASWETVAFVEQSLLLDPDRAYSWVSLGREHYALGNDVTALHATETALLCSPDDSSAIEQRIILTVNLDRHDEARPLLDKMKTVQPENAAWVMAVEAHIALCEGSYAAGLAASDAALAAGAQGNWLHIDRSRLLGFLGRATEATAELKDLWSNFKEAEVNDRLSYAWAALLLGHADKAEEIFQGCANDRISGLSRTQRYLGFVAVLRGELDTAKEHFDRSVEVAVSVRELNEWLVNDFETGEVQQRLDGKPHAARALALLDQEKDAAARRRATFPTPTTPLDEIRACITALETRGETTGWSWIGAQATAARLCLQARRWDEAEERFHGLEGLTGRFYVADEGLAQARYGRAVEPRVGTTPSAPSEDRTPVAIHDQRDDIERRRELTRRYGPTGLERLPLVTPLAIEAAANLKPILQANNGELDPDLANALGALRCGFATELGFEPPGVRVRLNETDLPDGTYIILLREVPLVSGNVTATQGLCNALTEELTKLGVKSEEAVNPANGSECTWVDRQDWPKVKAAGFDIWTAAEYVVLHLAAVTRKNASDLVGIYAVANLLRNTSPDQYARIVEAPGGISRFTSVIQALLSEEVPITALPEICDCYLKSLQLPTNEIPEEIRNLEAVRGRLPGNTADTPIFRLGKTFTSLIEQGIKREGEGVMLALEPEPTQEALTAIRNELSGLPAAIRNPVLLVEDWRVRTFVRKLVELEFPHLAVISEREALDPDSRPVLATIEPEPRRRPGGRSFK